MFSTSGKTISEPNTYPELWLNSTEGSSFPEKKQRAGTFALLAERDVREIN